MYFMMNVVLYKIEKTCSNTLLFNVQRSLF